MRLSNDPLPLLRQGGGGAATRIRLCWINWLAADAPRFDLQRMIEFCGTQLAGAWSVEIRNAVGRIGSEQASHEDDPASQAIAAFTFATEADSARFKAAFPAEIAAGDLEAPDRARRAG